MSEATMFDNAMPDGWYDDPATPDMQRWWTGTEWTEHVRYSDRVRPHAAPMDAPTTPLAIVDSSPWSEAYAAQRPPTAASTAQRYDPPPFDDFYVPMRTLQTRAQVGTQRRSATIIVLWLVAVAALGAAVGVALWVLLPH